MGLNFPKDTKEIIEVCDSNEANSLIKKGYRCNGTKRNIIDNINRDVYVCIKVEKDKNA